MWGFLAKAGAWAWAQKTEIGTAIYLWRRLRAKRKADQLPEESAKDYYRRKGFGAAVSSVRKVLKDATYDKVNGRNLDGSRKEDV